MTAPEAQTTDQGFQLTLTDQAAEEVRKFIAQGDVPPETMDDAPVFRLRNATGDQSPLSVLTRARTDWVVGRL